MKLKTGLTPHVFREKTRTAFAFVLNTAMVEAGYAYHYKRYSGSCESAENIGWAEEVARDGKLNLCFYDS